MAQKDIKVVINVNRPRTLRGFGHPLIVTTEATTPYTEYSMLEDIVSDYASTTETYKMVQALLGQEYQPDTFAIIGIGAVAVATDIINALIEIDDENWRYVIYNGVAWTDTIVKDLAAWFETENRIQILMMAENKTLFDDLASMDYENTAILVYDPSHGLYADAAWVGYNASFPAGGSTWKNTPLRGVIPERWTHAEINQLTERNVQTVVESTKRTVTTEGKSIGGEYIDVVLLQFFIIESIEYGTQELLINEPKLPYDNRGISKIESVANSVLQEAYENGAIAESDSGVPLWQTYFAGRDQVPVEERYSRNYKRGTFSFSIAGAIHTCRNIVGEMYF